MATSKKIKLENGHYSSQDNFYFTRDGDTVQISGHINKSSGVSGYIGNITRYTNHPFSTVYTDLTLRPAREVWIKWPLPGGGYVELNIETDGDMYISYAGASAYTGLSVSVSYICLGA